MTVESFGIDRTCNGQRRDAVWKSDYDALAARCAQLEADLRGVNVTRICKLEAALRSEGWSPERIAHFAAETPSTHDAATFNKDQKVIAQSETACDELMIACEYKIYRGWFDPYTGRFATQEITPSKTGDDHG